MRRGCGSPASTRAGRGGKPVQGQLGSFALRGKDIEIGGVALTLLNGSFRGKAELRQLDRYTVTGEISGVDTRRTAAMFYSTEPLPWDALVFGSVNLQGSLKRARDLRASGNLQLAPAPTGDPVHGEINVAYDASSGALDLGRSTVSLPHSRADFSGAINSELKVHLETTDLNDLLPVLGKSAADIPVKLSNGLILFDGIVAGDLNNPRITGHARASNFTFSDEHVDSLEADVAASADYLRVQNATAAQGPLRAQFQGFGGVEPVEDRRRQPDCRYRHPAECRRLRPRGGAARQGSAGHRHAQRLGAGERDHRDAARATPTWNCSRAPWAASHSTALRPTPATLRTA